MLNRRMGFAFIGFVTGLVTAGAVPVFGQAVQDIETHWPVTPSEVYRVEVNGTPLQVRRCDGRAGAASFVHAIFRQDGGEYRIVAPKAQGQWDVRATEPIKQLKVEKTFCTFVLDKPNKVLIQTAADERLFLFIEPPESNPVKRGDPGVLSLADAGVTPGGDGLVTQGIQKAIDEVAANDKLKILFVPPGLYRTGTLRIKSGVRVHLAPGSRLEGSTDPDDYPMDPGTQEKPDRTQDIRSRLILFEKAEWAALTGYGEIDGMGHIIRGEHRRVPNLIRVRRSRGIAIDGPLLLRAAGWCTHVFHSDQVAVKNLKAMSNYSDGFDADNSRNVGVSDVLISSYDDAFVIKATGFDEHAELVENVYLRNAVLWTVKSCIKIGTETLADEMKQISFDDVEIAGARGALVIYLRDGARVHRVIYRDIRVGKVRDNIDWTIRHRQGKGVIEDLALSNVRFEHPANWIMEGLDGEHPIRNILLQNVRLAGEPMTALPETDVNVNEHVHGLSFQPAGGSQ